MNVFYLYISVRKRCRIASRIFPPIPTVVLAALSNQVLQAVSDIAPSMSYEAYEV